MSALQALLAVVTVACAAGQGLCTYHAYTDPSGGLLAGLVATTLTLLTLALLTTIVCALRD